MVFVCILPEKTVPEMTYTVSGGTLNPTHSLTVHRNCMHPKLKDLKYLRDSFSFSGVDKRGARKPSLQFSRKNNRHAFKLH